MTKFIRGKPLLEKNKGKGQPMATPKGMNWSAFEAELEKRMKDKERVRDASASWRGELVDSRRSHVNHRSPAKTPIMKGEVVSPESKSSKSLSRRSPALHEYRNDIEKPLRNERGKPHQEKHPHKKESRTTTGRSIDPCKDTPRRSLEKTNTRFAEQNVQEGTKRDDERSSGDCNTKTGKTSHTQKKEIRPKHDLPSPEQYHGKIGSTKAMTMKFQEDKLTGIKAKENGPYVKTKDYGLNVDCENDRQENSAMSVVNEHRKDVSSSSTLDVIDACDKTYLSVSGSKKKPNKKGKLKWLKNRLSKDLPISNAMSMRSDKCSVELTTPTPRYQTQAPSRDYTGTSSEQLQRWVKALTCAITEAKTTQQAILERKPSDDSGIFETPHKLEDNMTDCHTQATECEANISDNADRHRSQFITVRSVEYDVMSETYDDMDIESVSSLEILYNWLTCRDEPEIAPRLLRKHGPVASLEDW
jgi:hypothetical protein